MGLLIKQLRLFIMIIIIDIALLICPKECKQTLIWFSDLPMED